MRQVKLNAFLHPNEHPERICVYLVRQFEAELAISGHTFTTYSVTRKFEKISAFNESSSLNLIVK